jgi:hypothetical protein
MVRLVFFELKKHFFKKAVFIALIIFSVINILKIVSVYNTESYLAMTEKWDTVYFEQLENYGGEITLDKINALLAVYRPVEQKVADRTATTATDVPGTLTGNYYSDEFLLRWYFTKPMEYSFMYEANANEIAAAAKENVTFYEKHGNTYMVRENAAIADIFNGRKVKQFGYTEMYQIFIKYDFSILLVLLLCIYGISSVFSIEKETDMELLLVTSRNGSLKTVFAKIAASLLFAVAISVWFWALDFTAFALVFGNTSGGALPLYALQDFSGTPLDITAGAYVLFSDVIKTLGVITICMCFSAIAVRAKNALLPFIVSLLSAIGLIYIADIYASSSYTFMKIISPFALLENRTLFRKIEFVNLFGFPVQSYIAAIIIGILWCLVFGVLVCVLSRKNTVKGGRTK